MHAFVLCDSWLLGGLVGGLVL